MWGWSLPWHKVLNAVVAELSIYKLKRTHRFSVTLSFTPIMTCQTIHHISILNNKIALIFQLSWLTYCLILKPT